MREFSQLLDALVYTRSRSTKLKLIGDYLRRTPDPDRGYALAALTGELNLPAVVKRNGTRTEFDRSKLRASMALALRKRPVSAEAVDAALHRIEEKLLSLGLREVGSEQVGELVMRELKKLDKIGYVRFASVYRKFEDVDEFADAIQEVQARRRRGSAPQD